jgi:hypothetical protein
MAWLVSGARVLASAEIATDRKARRRGLLGRDSFEGALLIERCRWVHTVGMRFPIDVAYLDDNGTVIRIEQMKPHRVSAPVKASATVIEAEAGAFARWELQLGDQIEIRLVDEDERPEAP